MNVLLIGSGGREHALAWKISQSPLLSHLYIAPGNAGTHTSGTNVSLDVDDFGAVKAFCEEKSIAMIVVGPEVPLVAGLSDYVHDELPDITVIGPKKDGAMLEGSKEFSKQFMLKHGVPTAKAMTFGSDQVDEGKAFLASMDAPYVLKADGLAAGKGVIIAQSLQEAQDSLQEMLHGQFGDASSRVLVEEFMDGIEFSVFALIHGQDYVILPHAKDYKRAGEGDTGLNTGGMGAVSPVPFVDAALMDQVKKNVIEPTANGLVSDGIDYTGFIYFGLMNMAGTVKVVEYNVRLGDPETQVVLPRIKSDLLDMFRAAGTGQLASYRVEEDSRACSAVVIASGGYPASYEKGKAITSPDTGADQIIFHAGTKAVDGQVVTSGGRVMAATGLGSNLKESLSRAYDAAGQILFEGKYLRKDIGQDIID